MRHARRHALRTLAALSLLPAFRVEAATAAEIDAEADAAMAALTKAIPAASSLSKKAVATLIFPSIVKAGLMVGAQYGEGVMRKRGKSVAYYSSLAGSYGLQAGVQKYGYVLFLMTPAAVDYIEKTDGWEVGVGPSFVLVDEGSAKSLTTTSLKSDIYAFIFSQKGLMAGLGVQGAKISKIDK